MRAERFTEILGADFYTGVPDSQLKALCSFLIDRYGIDPMHHIIAANEGNCAALAAGYHMATGKVPVVYMQNSGEGNIINPAASLLNEKVYGIPVIFVIGWRGEPGVHDEPQHIYQGEVTRTLLDDMGIRNTVIGRQTTEEELEAVMKEYRGLLEEGHDVAFVIRKGALTYDKDPEYKNDYMMRREDIIRHVTAVSGDDPIVSTTGKASRELFEIRTAANETHERDFLTVGSMGHCSSIALGIAIRKPGTRIWCIDGDGAALMHMGALAVIASVNPKNLVHIVINNGSHESVGGMPTVLGRLNIAAAAAACGYPHAVTVSSFEELDGALETAVKNNELTMIEVKAAIGARDDLGRPTTTALENKESFMNYLKTRK